MPKERSKPPKLVYMAQELTLEAAKGARLDADRILLLGRRN